MKSKITQLRPWNAMARRLAVVIAALGLSWLACPAAYEINWFTVDGGGGTSASADGQFSLSGTAGQPDAGLFLSGDGQFQIYGGFWQAADLSCACRLSVEIAGGNVTVSWPCDLNGCVLEATDVLGQPSSGTVWTPVIPQPTGHTYTAPATGRQRYFRLHTPQMAAGFVELSAASLEHLSDDTDGDGIPDERERMLGLDPNRADTDGDGFSDLFEDTFRAFGFDPLRPDLDSDHDGLTDAFEIAIGTNPFDPDTDHDGWLDSDELLHADFGYDPRVFDPDADYDGVSDRLEMVLGTSTASPDTDGDGLMDEEELRVGTNPLVPDDPARLGELVGRTVSDAMWQAWQDMRQGAPFPPNLARELACPEIFAPFFNGSQKSHAAKDHPPMRPIPSNPPITPAGDFAYPTYNTIVYQLLVRALRYDGRAAPNIMRLFRYPFPTDGGRFIYAVKITRNPGVIDPAKPAILFMADHHGRELITPAIAMGFIKELTENYAAGDPTVRHYVDNAEIWVVPLVNPDGYTMAVGEYAPLYSGNPRGWRVNWRKNTRRVSELQAVPGVDPNRNYGFEHVSEFSLEERRRIQSPGQNGVNSFTGQLEPDSPTYAGPSPFSEVETRAIRALASGSFTAGGPPVALRGSLSWHSWSGAVIHPMDHPMTRVEGLTPGDRARFDMLTAACAAATGYQDWRDAVASHLYAVYGDSDQWLYKEKGVFAITVEAYSDAEWANEGPRFFPIWIAKQNAVVANNVHGALAFLGAFVP